MDAGGRAGDAGRSKGVQLSGGQVQRTAAARMFVRESELLVFDDLSSALDVETEQCCGNGWMNAETARRGLTCLVVSHRRRAAPCRSDHRDERRSRRSPGHAGRSAGDQRRDAAAVAGGNRGVVNQQGGEPWLSTLLICLDTGFLCALTQSLAKGDLQKVSEEFYIFKLQRNCNSLRFTIHSFSLVVNGKSIGYIFNEKLAAPGIPSLSHCSRLLIKRSSAVELP